MKTATLDAGGMSSMLDYRGVEKQLGRIPGVKQVTASIASNSATVEYDENVTNVAALKDKIEECGFHCAGRILPMTAGSAGRKRANRSEQIRFIRWG